MTSRSLIFGFPRITAQTSGYKKGRVIIMKLSTKILALIMAAAACTAMLVSCGDDEKDTNVSGDGAKIESEADKQNEDSEPKDMSEVFELGEEVRFDGETFSMYIAHSTRNNDYIIEEENGDLINDAKFKRNELTKQRLGIDLNFVGSTLTTSGTDQTTESNKISSLILAGDTTYDAYIQVQHGAMPGLIQEGMFIDWYDLPHIDFSKAWWFSNTLRDINFGGKVFAMTGDYNLASTSGCACVAFNKTMLDELELEYPYQMVFDGTWTHDKFVEYIQAATKDLNGDGQLVIADDRYGYNGWSYEQLYALYIGYGGQHVIRDDNALPKLSIYSERQANVIEKMLQVFANPGAVYEDKTYGVAETMFKEERLLFINSGLSAIPGYRNHEFDVGFVPYPKLNEEQENYYARTGNTTCLTYIPVTLPEDRYPLVGATLETMAYYSHVEVLPKYFDTVLTVQSTRDIESEQMIPIIKDGSRFMDHAIGFDPAGIVRSGQNTLASHWMSSKSKYEEKLASLIKTYE